MVTVEHLQPHQIIEAKYLIAAVAQRIYYPHKTPEYFHDILEEEGELKDIDDFQNVYEQNHGVFLAVLDNDRLVGTGALKRMDSSTAELKRLWLLEEYQGRGIGHRVVVRLFAFARENGYSVIRLQTSPEQVRAIAFYKMLGFYDIPCYNHKTREISMELDLYPARSQIALFSEGDKRNL
ncbi:MAG: GNAT family N-acetyltransferase [Anaerolineales bacterium]|nr:GNAT family N-acetyltransferase [Anaerolineales bacterium]